MNISRSPSAIPSVADGFARHLRPPYVAVMFTSTLKPGVAEAGEYGAMADCMAALAARQPGYLGAESTRGADGLGITVSYWADEASVIRWKAHPEHLEAQTRGRRDWYAHYELRIARVERAGSLREIHSQNRQLDDHSIVK
jgi:heme-degrading monooxygenase HmoA